MKIIGTVLFVALLTSCGNISTTVDSTTSKLYATYSKSVFDLQLQFKDNTNWYHDGTAFLVDGSTLLTAKHCVDIADVVGFRVKCGNAIYDVIEVVKSPTYDLAFLKIKKISGLKPFVIKSIPPPKVGTDTYALGYPFDYTLSISAGFVNVEEQTNPEGIFTTFSAIINPGNSGGPLIDKNGNLLGVVVAKDTRTEAFQFAVPIRFVVEEYKKLTWVK